MGEKMIPVRAKGFGQKPDGSFVKEGDEFEVPESKLSKIWHERLDGGGKKAAELDMSRVVPVAPPAPAPAAARGRGPGRKKADKAGDAKADDVKPPAAPEVKSEPDAGADGKNIVDQEA